MKNQSHPKPDAGQRLKTLIVAAMLCAMAYVVMVLFRIPVILFLKYEPKDVIIAMGGLMFGPLMSLLISTVVSVVEAVTVSDTGWIGCLMNILSSCSFACTASFIYSKKRTQKGAALGLLAGSLLATAVMLLWNYFITPLYMGYPREAVAALLIPAFLPFNLLKHLLNAAFVMLLYPPVVTALRRARLLAPSRTAAKKEHKLGWILVAALVLVSCILLMLVLAGVL